MKKLKSLGRPCKDRTIRKKRKARRTHLKKREAYKFFNMLAPYNSNQYLIENSSSPDLPEEDFSFSLCPFVPSFPKQCQNENNFEINSMELPHIERLEIESHSFAKKCQNENDSEINSIESPSVERQESERSLFPKKGQNENDSEMSVIEFQSDQSSKSKASNNTEV